MCCTPCWLSDLEVRVRCLVLHLRGGDLCIDGNKFVIDPTLESEVREVTLAIDARDDTQQPNPKGFWACTQMLAHCCGQGFSMPNAPETHRLIERDIRRGLAYMLTSRRASKVEVTASQGKRVGEVIVDITITRGNEVLLSLRFEELWRELGFTR